MSGEWIRLTDPVYKENRKPSRNSQAAVKKENAYADLRKAVDALDQYTRGMEGYSNYELNKMKERILELMSDH